MRNISRGPVLAKIILALVIVGLLVSYLGDYPFWKTFNSELNSEQSIKITQDLSFTSAVAKRYLIEGTDIVVIFTVDSSGKVIFTWNKVMDSPTNFILKVQQGGNLRTIQIAEKGGKLPPEITIDLNGATIDNLELSYAENLP
jgi:hypothetical protein